MTDTPLAEKIENVFKYRSNYYRAVLDLAREHDEKLSRLREQLTEANESLARVRRLAAEDSTAEQRKRVAAEQEAEQARRERDEEVRKIIRGLVRETDGKTGRERAINVEVNFVLGVALDRIRKGPSALQGGEAGQVEASDIHRSIEVSTARREHLRLNGPQCPACSSRQVQLTAYMQTVPARWKCRERKERFEYEPFQHQTEAGQEACAAKPEPPKPPEGFQWSFKPNGEIDVRRPLDGEWFAWGDQAHKANNFGHGTRPILIPATPTPTPPAQPDTPKPDYFCTRCGWFGSGGALHHGCNYYATRLFDGAAEQLRKLADATPTSKGGE